MKLTRKSRGRPPHVSPGVAAPGRIDDVSKALRLSRLFVAPALVPSGISTKVWLALEHGLPVLTTPDGARGLPKTAARAFDAGLAPFLPFGALSPEAADALAPAAAAAYCNATTWQRHALAALAVAKDLESRAPWTGPDGPLGDIFTDPPPLACEPASPALARTPAEDDADATSLLGAVRETFDGLLATKGRGDCRTMVRAVFD